MVTQMWTDVFPTERAAEGTPIGRGGAARDVANLIVYLASTESDFSTGSEFVVDGGEFWEWRGVVMGSDSRGFVDGNRCYRAIMYHVQTDAWGHLRS
jgi:hypothetical protein